MAVDLDGMPPEGTGAGGVDGCIPTEVRRSPLAQAVHVQNGDDVVQLVMAGLVEGFPDGAFGQLAVTQQHPHIERQLVDVLAAEGHTDADRQALPEGAGGHIHPGQTARRPVIFGALQRLRMTFEAAAELAQRHQLVVGNDARCLVHRIEQRAGMSFGKNQAVVIRVAWMAPVVLEIVDQEHRHQIGGRHRGRRVARFGRRCAPDAVHPELPPQLRDALPFVGHENTPSDGRVALLPRVHVDDAGHATNRTSSQPLGSACQASTVGSP